MISVTLLDLLSCLASLAALFIVLAGSQQNLKRGPRWLFFGLLILAGIHNLANLLEWSGFVSVPNSAEDSVRLLWPTLWGCFFYLLMQEQTEQDLYETGTRYRTLFEDSPISLWEEDFSEIKVYIDGLKVMGITDFRKYFAEHPDIVKHCASMAKVLDINQATLSLLGMASKRDLLRSLDNVFSDEAWDVFREELIALAEGHTRFETISLQRNSSGELLVTELRLSVAAGYERTWAKVFVSAIDITQRVQTEQALRESEKKYRELVDNSLVGIYITQNHILKFCNQGLARLFGYEEPEDMIGKHISELVASESWERVDTYVKLRESGIMQAAHYEFRVVKADGSLCDVEVVGGTIVHQGKPAIHGTMIDITERKRTERLLQALNQTARAMDRAVTPGEIFAVVAEEFQKLGIQCVVLLTDDTRSRLSSQYVSFLSDTLEVAEKLVGVQRSNFSFPIAKVDLYRKVVEEKKTVFSEDMEESLRQLLPRFTKHFASQLVRMFNVTKSIAAPLIVEDTVIGVLYVQSNDLIEDDVSLVTAFAHQLASAWRKAQLFEQAQQEIERRAQVEAEVRELNLELEQRVMERTAELTTVNKELEAFAYSVSHDLRAPLRSIDGFSRILMEEYVDVLDTTGQSHLRRVQAATHRMGQLIDDLLQLSRVTRKEMLGEWVNLSEIVQAVAADLRASQPGRQVAFEIAESLPVRGDARLLRLALENLIENAWKFTEKQVNAKIEFGTSEFDGELAYFVRDNGAGFDMQYANKLFKAFQRLHSVTEFEGTGVGLATVQRIIHRHGGRVWAEGVVGQGATFYFTLQFGMEPRQAGGGPR